MIRVITYGVFDLLHLGHLRLFANIRRAIPGDVHLTVAIHADDCINATKPNTNMVYTQSERQEILGYIKTVDDIIVYDFIDTDLPNRDFDVLAVGPDQTNEHFIRAIEWCRAHNRRVITIPRTENICSSKLRKGIS